MELWIVVHHHRHGVDLYPFLRADEPTQIEDHGSTFEPEIGEEVETRLFHLQKNGTEA